eukprot:3844754-Prymnesium_polylepis.2
MACAQGMYVYVGEQGYIEAAWGSLGKRSCVWTRQHLMVTRTGSITAHRNSTGRGYVMVYDPQTQLRVIHE